MPVYEFTCHSCQTDFDLLCPSGTEAKEVRCPKCHQNHLTKKFSVFGIVSKGDTIDLEEGSCSSEACGGESCSSDACDESFGCGASGCCSE